MPNVFNADDEDMIGELWWRRILREFDGGGGF